MSKKNYKERLKFEKANAEMYKSLYKAAFQEHQHQGIQKQAVDTVVCDIDDLLRKWIKNSLIRKYIENWRGKICLNNSIHFDEIVWI